MSEPLRTLKDRGFFAQCTNEDELGRLLDRETVGFYVGIDPTGPSMHIGHLVPLYAMAHLARAGHRAVPLIGAGTARIGDPSGKTETRQMLTVEQINANVETMSAQITRFLEAAGAGCSIVNNAEWLVGLNYIEFLRDIGKHFSVNRMLTFETYRMRLETGLSFIEFNYQLLQSFDFLELYRNHGVKLQIGGDDQWGNIVAGVDLIRRVEGGEAFGLTFPLVTRADGKKMGKTEKGALFLDPSILSPYEFFQYWRNVPDADVEKFLLGFTFLPTDECRRLGELEDREANDAKEVLALKATALIHGREAALQAKEAARSAFGAGGRDMEGIPEIRIERRELQAGIGVLDLFSRTDLCGSRSEARRLVQQGGARINEQQITDTEAVINESFETGDGLLLKAGKKRYFRVVVN